MKKPHRAHSFYIAGIAAVAIAAIAAAALIAAPARTPRRTPQPPSDPTVASLRDQALASDLAWQLVSSLTTEVGPRSAGSDGDRRGVEWALAAMKRLGFENVRSEPVTVPHW